MGDSEELAAIYPELSSTTRTYISTIVEWLKTTDETTITSLGRFDPKTGRNLYHNFNGFQDAVEVATRYFTRKGDTTTIARIDELLTRSSRSKRNGKRRAKAEKAPKAKPLQELVAEEAVPSSAWQDALKKADAGGRALGRMDLYGFYFDQEATAQDINDYLSKKSRNGHQQKPWELMHQAWQQVQEEPTVDSVLVDVHGEHQKDTRLITYHFETTSNMEVIKRLKRSLYYFTEGRIKEELERRVEGITFKEFDKTLQELATKLKKPVITTVTDTRTTNYYPMPILWLLEDHYSPLPEAPTTPYHIRKEIFEETFNRYGPFTKKQYGKLIGFLERRDDIDWDDLINNEAYRELTSLAEIMIIPLRNTLKYFRQTGQKRACERVDWLIDTKPSYQAFAKKKEKRLKEPTGRDDDGDYLLVRVGK